MSPMASSHILLIPFLAKGHLIPFAALAALLEKKTSYTITIISTPSNILTVQSILPAKTSIRLSSVPYNSSDHGLPPDTECTDAVTRHLSLRFILSTHALLPAVDAIVAGICAEEGRPPLCIISDLLMPWSFEVAQKYGVFHGFFITGGAYAACQMTVALDNKTKAHENDQRYKASSEADPALAEFRTNHRLVLKASDGVLVNSVEEVERNGLENLKSLVKRAWAIGPVIRIGCQGSISPISCTQWLNLHPPNSVLYISFGSENFLNPNQMMELAKGLEACGSPFIWSLKKLVGSDEEEEWLPEGFEDRMTERKQGLLIREWAPQLEILAHQSTGAFLSHCGWNSTLESLWHGVPVIGWPMDADQFFNSELLEKELGLGVEMARESTAVISGADVATVVGLVMDGESEKAKEMRKKGKQVQEMMKAALVDEDYCKGSSVGALEDFIQTVVEWKKNQ